MTISANKTYDITLSDQSARNSAIFGIDRNFLMEAGAGTGKTSILVDRFIEIIARNAAKIDEIAAITFTEKAAAEMAERVYDKMETLLSSPNYPAQKIQNIKTALNNFQNHRISTIHSFARTILMETPFEAGVDPSFRLLDETQEKEIIDEIWEEWMKSAIDNKDPVIYGGFMIGIKRSFFKSIFDFFYAERGEIDNLNLKPEEPVLGEIFENIKKISCILTDIAENFCSNKSDASFSQIKNIEKYLKRIESSDKFEKIRLLLEWSIGSPNSGKKEDWGGKKEEKKALITEIKEELTNAKYLISRWFTDASYLAFKNLISEIEKKKIKDGFLSTDDLLLKTRDLLRDNKKIRQYYKNKFKKLLVDEFQDTDPVQAQIIFYLCEKPELFEQDFQKCDPLEGKLFIVGDPKQSIYGFRKADIEIYEQVKQVFDNAGNLLNISDNFRTLPQIIEWVNAQFSKIIVPPADGNYQPSYKPLTPTRQQNEKKSLVLLLPENEEKIIHETSESASIAEAKAIASFLRNNAGEFNRSDVAILLPKYLNINFYENALKNAGVPYLLEGGRHFFQRQEVEDLINALKAIENPRDQVSLVAALKSAFFGASDEDLLSLCIDGRGIDYLNDAQKPAVKNLLHEQYKILRELHEIKNTVSLTRLVEKLLEKTGAGELYTAVFNDARRLANLEKFLFYAGSFEKQKGGGLGRFIKFLENARDEKIKEPDA